MLGRRQFQRRNLVQTGEVAGRVDEKITVFGRTVRLWQTNVSWEAIYRTRTPNCLSKGKQYNIAFTQSGRQQLINYNFVLKMVKQFQIDFEGQLKTEFEFLLTPIDANFILRDRIC